MAKDDVTKQKRDEAPKRRVVCLVGTDKSINGYSFATITMPSPGGGEMDVHVSEQLPAEVADRFESIEGAYQPFTGDEEKYARTIEDALVESRKAVAVARNVNTEAPIAARLDEQRRTNLLLSEELRAAHARIEQLNTELDAEKSKSQKLTADGARLGKSAPTA
jgi:hypothetical protein